MVNIDAVIGLIFGDPSHVELFDNKPPYFISQCSLGHSRDGIWSSQSAHSLHVRKLHTAAQGYKQSGPYRKLCSGSDLFIIFHRRVGQFMPWLDNGGDIAITFSGLTRRHPTTRNYGEFVKIFKITAVQPLI